MSPTALLLVLLAALCHSGWNLIVKTDPRRLEIQSGALWVGALICAPVLYFHSPWELPPQAWVAVVVSAALESAYVLALSSAYAAGDMSLVYPVARGSGSVSRSVFPLDGNGFLSPISGRPVFTVIENRLP